jgi:hypothetical protein
MYNLLYLRLAFCSDQDQENKSGLDEMMILVNSGCVRYKVNQ